MVERILFITLLISFVIAIPLRDILASSPFKPVNSASISAGENSRDAVEVEQEETTTESMRVVIESKFGTEEEVSSVFI